MSGLTTYGYNAKSLRINSSRLLSCVYLILSAQNFKKVSRSGSLPSGAICFHSSCACGSVDAIPARIALLISSSTNSGVTPFCIAICFIIFFVFDVICFHHLNRLYL